MNIDELVSDLSNQDKIAIVVVGYNRIHSIKRLLNSLLDSEYPSNDIPLVISIDCSGDIELYDYVSRFEWPFGDKYVNIQKERLGLKDHIYKCGDLTEYFRAIVLLEDDLVVSPYFYSYVVKMLNTYGDESKIAQISLYKNEMNGYVGLPFDNLQKGYDVFLMQDVSTWGECWNKRMWSDFRCWLNEHDEAYVQNVDMPQAIKDWTRAWSKYYNAYVVDTGKYVLYPNIAVATNFSDAGEHGGNNNSIVQVNLLQSDFEYRLAPCEDLICYDIYFNNAFIYNWLNLSPDELCLDLYGFNPNNFNKRYVVSTRILPYKILKSYALNMRPIELNIKNNIYGEGIYLYDTSIKWNADCNKLNGTLIAYFLRAFNIKYLLRYVIRYCFNAIKRKLFI